ncbi:MAG: V-type ATPase 116kDa subunit family protein [Gammaproteobacteria bacterium]
MPFHPKTTHWFEAYVPRDQMVYALEALANTGRVELARDPVEHPLPDTEELRLTLEHARGLIRDHAGLLPAAPRRTHVVTHDPEATARHALETLHAWLRTSRQQEHRLAELRQRRDNLALLGECLQAMGSSERSLMRFRDESRFLCKMIFACERDHAPIVKEDLEGVIETHRGPDHGFQVLMCLPELRERFREQCHTEGGWEVHLPEWLFTDWRNKEAHIARDMRALDEGLEEHIRAARIHKHDPALLKALGEIETLAWYLDHTLTLTGDRRHCHVTGWTDEGSSGTLQTALDRAEINARVLIRPAPIGSVPPTALNDSWLVRPFRPFVHVMGTPGAQELDPAPLLAFIVPLLFGFMFPDLGHGLVLAVGALLLARRFPYLAFLIPCGLAAALFGALLGESFGVHDASPVLAIRPMEEPLLVLLASLILGACIILLGMVLSGIEAWWRGEFRQWLWLDAAVLTLYLGVVFSALHINALIASAVGLVWYLCGLLVTRRHSVPRGLGRLAYSAFELSLNTLSFLRIGAFALAHVALSRVIHDSAMSTGSALMEMTTLVLGHGLIIFVEGFLVYIQTTRLVLFEFSARFLRAEGRIFRPLHQD